MVININLPAKNANIDTDLYIRVYNDNDKSIDFIYNYINNKFKNINSFSKAHSLTQLYGVFAYLSVINNENSKAEDIERSISILGASIFVFFAPIRPETKNEYLETIDNSKHFIDLLLSDGLLKPQHEKPVKMEIDGMASRYGSDMMII